MEANRQRNCDEFFMRMALKLAKKALAAGELPIGAVIVIHQDVVGTAYCDDKHDRKLAHAELLALIKVDARHPSADERRTMTLYTTLEPCVMCLGASLSFGLGRIVYGATAPADGAVSRLAGIPFGDATYPGYRMPEVAGGVLAEESRALFRAYRETSTDRALVNFARGIGGEMVT
jgi:tRNA(adenine34) deaminase